MSVDDYCRLCKENLRIKGSLSNTKKIFDSKKVAIEKSVDERLSDLGLTLSKDNSKSSRICRSCLRLLGRIEKDFVIFRRWQEAEKETSPEVSTSTVPIQKRVPCEPAGFARPLDQPVRIQDREPTPAKMPMAIIEVFPDPPAPIRTPTRKLPRPNTVMAARPRQSLTEVIIRYPSHPKGDKITCQPNTAGMVENIAKENWRTAANLIVRHKGLFGQLKENILQVIEDESKILCNPYKGFMLWRSTAGDLKAFSFASLQSDLQRMSPFLFSIFSQITKRSPYSTCSAAAIALRGREPRLSAFAYYVDSVLQYGGARKAVFNRLSKLGITTSHTCAVRKHREMTNSSGEDFQLLKVGNEIFSNSQNENEEEEADDGDGGSVVQGADSANLTRQMAFQEAPATAVAELDILIVDSDEDEPSSGSMEGAVEPGGDDDGAVEPDEDGAVEPDEDGAVEPGDDDDSAVEPGDDDNNDDSNKRKLKDAETSAKRQRVDKSADADDVITLDM